MKRITVYFSCILLSVSCKDNTPDIDKMADDFAGIECRAVALREKRFALANEIRFTQDTLLNKQHITDTSRLKIKLERLNQAKETILQTSLALADSIHKQLDSLMQHHLTDATLKSKFNTALNNTLQKRNCVEKL